MRHAKEVDPTVSQAEDTAFLQAENDADRKHEGVLVPKTLIALACIGVLEAVRQVWFV